MAVRTFNEGYKEHAVKNFAGAVDYALRIMKMDAEDFSSRFLNGGVASSIESGNPRYLMAPAVVLYEEITGEKATVEYNSLYTSAVYSAAETLASFQWESARSYYEILAVFPLSEIISFGGGSEEFREEFIRRLRTKKTNLEYLRTSAGLSQSELAALSGVDIRSIQTYEQRRNDIYKAQYNILNALAGVLSCSVEDLMDERNFRLVTLRDDKEAGTLFLKQAVWEAERMQNRITYASPFQAAREAKTYFYVYGFLSALPVKKITFSDGEYKLNSGVLLNSWDKYWGAVVDSASLSVDEKKELKEKVHGLCPNAEYEISLTPQAIVYAALSAIEEIIGKKI